MPDRTTPESATKTPTGCICWLIATVVLASTALGFTVTGHGDHPMSWVPRIAAAVVGIGWLIRAAEARLAGELKKAVKAAWWMGYATCLEDQTGQGEETRKVVPFRCRSSDKISDTAHRVNGTEHH